MSEDNDSTSSEVIIEVPKNKVGDRLMAYFRKIYTCAEAPHRAKRVYMYLCNRYDSQNKAFPSIPSDCTILLVLEIVVHIPRHVYIILHEYHPQRYSHF